MQRISRNRSPYASDPADFGVDYAPERLGFSRFIGVSAGVAGIVIIMLAGLVNGWAN